MEYRKWDEYVVIIRANKPKLSQSANQYMPVLIMFAFRTNITEI